MNRSMYNGNKTHLRLNKEAMFQLPRLTPALFPIQSYKPGMLGIPQANTTRFLPVQNFQQQLPTTRREMGIVQINGNNNGRNKKKIHSERPHLFCVKTIQKSVFYHPFAKKR